MPREDNERLGRFVAQDPFFTLNTDSSVKVSEHRAVACGCLRDANGKLMDVFATNLGNCSITRAELSDVVIGLERAWEAGVCRVKVQTDSICAVKLLSEGVPINHQHASLVERFKLIVQKD
ncbi:Putative ribonuclease H protein At1g65750 [Linum perenne]